MASFVYQATLDYKPAGEVLASIRHTVKELKESNPELSCCELADVSLQRREHDIAVTLYFEGNG